MPDAVFTSRELVAVLSVLTEAHTSGALSYDDTMLLLDTVDKMAKAGIA